MLARLKKGDGIGVFTPSFPGNLVLKDKYLQAIQNLEELGFEVIEGFLTKQFLSEGYRVANAKERAKEFNLLYKDKRVKLLMPTIGGYCTCSILEHLDYDYINSVPKFVCGYSDISSLHAGLLKHTNIKPIYGVSLIPSFGEYPRPFKETLKYFFIQTGFKRKKLPVNFKPTPLYSTHFIDATDKNWKNVNREYIKNEGWKVFREGVATGKCIIMNQNTLLSMAGTKYFPSFKDKILILEQMNSSISLEERQLNQLRLIGVFKDIKGLIFSKFEKYDNQNSSIDFLGLIEEFISDQGSYPIIYNFDCGHIHPSISIPQLVELSFKVTKKNIKLTQNDFIYSS